MLTVDNEVQGRWHHHPVRTYPELGPVLGALADAMAASGYGARDVFAMRLALEEAVVNGLKHGNQGDPAKEVRVRFRVTAEATTAEVEDQGPGFDPGEVADPLDPENLERPCGRGLLLMRAYLSWCRFNDRGNRVILCRERSAA